MKHKSRRLSAQERQEVLSRLSVIIARQENVVFAYAYGSFPEGIPFHDLDIGLYLLNPDETSVATATGDLAAELEGAARVPADVRVLNFAPTAFLFHVLRGTLLFERDPDVRAAVAERTVRSYLDIKPLLAGALREAYAA